MKEKNQKEFELKANMGNISLKNKKFKTFSSIVWEYIYANQVLGVI